MHESLSRFSESFASFLYGLNMNAFCVDFPEAPIPDSFRRAKEREEEQEQERRKALILVYMTNCADLTIHSDRRWTGSRKRRW
jgi:hypothetical protein